MTNTTDKQILTAAGKALLAQLNAEEKPLIIDKMIFANVPNRPEYPQPDDVVPADNVVHEAAVEQRGRLSADSVIYSTTLTSQEGPFDFNWTGAYCSEYGVLVTIDHHALTPKTADEPGVAGNTLVRSVVLEYKDIAEITNITVDASSWQYNATPRMKKMDDDVAQSIIDQNGKDWFIEDGFLVTPQASAFNIKAGAGYVSGNRVTLEFDRNVQVPNKPSFIYVDAHREGTPTGEQVTLFDLVVTAEEKDDYTDANGVKHFVCKIAQVLADGSVSDLRPEGESASREWVGKEEEKQTLMLSGQQGYLVGKINEIEGREVNGETALKVNDYPKYGESSFFLMINPPHNGIVESIDLNSGQIAIDGNVCTLSKFTEVVYGVTTQIKNKLLGHIKAYISYAYNSVSDGGDGVWVQTGSVFPLRAGSSHAKGSIYAYDAAGVEFVSVDMQLHNVGVLSSDEIDQTAALQTFFSEIAPKREVITRGGNYLVDIGSLEAPLTDGTDQSRAAIVLNVPVTIKGRGTFKAKDATGLVKHNNYFFATGVEGCRFRSVNTDGNRLNVNSSYGIQINHNDTMVTDWSRLNNLDGSPVVVNGIDPQNPLTDIVIPNNISDNCANTVFCGYVKDIQAGGWKVRNASEGLDLDKRVVGGNFDGWIISLKRGAGADAALEINGGKEIQANNWTSRDFIRGIIVNGKVVDGVEYRSENCSCKGHTIINPTSHGITIGNALGNNDDAIDCSFDGYTIINSGHASVNGRGQNCSFKKGTIRNSQREGILHNGGSCDYEGTKVYDSARASADILAGYANLDSVHGIGSNKEDAQYNAFYFRDGTSGSLVGARTDGGHEYSLQATGNVNLRFDNNEFKGGKQPDDVKISSGTNLYKQVASAVGGLSFFGSARVFEAPEAFIPTSSFAPKQGDIIIHTNENPMCLGRRWNNTEWKPFGAFV